MSLETIIQIKRGNATSWISENPILNDGEFGLDKTNWILKIGDGTTPWIDLPIFSIINPFIIPNGFELLNKIILKSAIVDFKIIAETNIFTVPTGYMFSMDTMEILTTSINTPVSAPFIHFGTSLDDDAYYTVDQTQSNNTGERHIIENPQNAISAGTIVTFGITIASTATAHSGCGIISGTLFKIF